MGGWVGGSSVGFLHLPYVQYTVYISQDTYAAVFLAIMAWCDGVEVEGFFWCQPLKAHLGSGEKCSSHYFQVSIVHFILVGCFICGMKCLSN